MHEACSRKHGGLRLLALFLAVTLGFAAYRHSTFVVWNDSDAVFRAADGADPARLREEERERFRRAPAAALKAYGAAAFRCLGGGGYRPISHLWESFWNLSFYDDAAPSLLLLLAVGALHGLLAVSLFAVARRFVRRDLTALAAAALVLASPPLAACAWVCVAGVQALVPLLFCLSLLSYWCVT